MRPPGNEAGIARHAENFCAVSDRKEAWVGVLLVGGLVLAGVGVVLTSFLYFGGAVAAMRNDDPNLFAVRVVGPLTIFLGLLTSGGALFYGIREGRSLTSKSGPVVDPTARVLSRYAFDRDGDMLTDEDAFELRDGVKFYVKLELTGGAHREFHCSRSVYDCCGEGLRGAATFDGKWLGGFQATLPRPPA
jgi:hypothetical protein